MPIVATAQGVKWLLTRRGQWQLTQSDMDERRKTQTARLEKTPQVLPRGHVAASAGKVLKRASVKSEDEDGTRPMNQTTYV